ncbi:hypothetical protein PIB30_081885 [Stylosanthes scabra]|uniref:Uncharacterized protein n=1 Tax=Stylosanthes scabra TaxID=79078 RepID=A0ABU6TSF9_9FABA|nr:hypothetical protein [Stylosanthes scabra]
MDQLNDVSSFKAPHASLDLDSPDSPFSEGVREAVSRKGEGEVGDALVRKRRRKEGEREGWAKTVAVRKIKIEGERK